MSNTPELVAITGGEDVVGMFLLEAIVASRSSHEDALAHFLPDLREGCNEVAVTLLVNGTQVPFKSVIDGFFSRMLSHLDEEVENRAKQLVTEAGLDRIRTALERAEWDISEAIRRTLQARE